MNCLLSPITAAWSLSFLLTQLAPADQPIDVSELIEQLRDTRVKTRRKAAAALANNAAEATSAIPALIKALDDEDQQVWAQSINALARMGPHANAAIPRLVTGLSREGQRGYRSAHALGQIGSKAIPPLLNALDTDQVVIRRSAMRAIAWMGDKAVLSSTRLIEHLDDEDPTVRNLTTRCLGNIGPGSLPFLRAVLLDKSTLVRAGAVEAVGRIGTPALDTANEVLQLTTDENATVRAAALKAMTTIGLQAKKVVPSLLAALKDEDDSVRGAAVAGLLRYRSETIANFSTLMELLHHGDIEVVRSVTLAIALLGSDAAVAIPELMQLLATDDEQRKAVFQRTLEDIQSEQPTVSE